MANSSDYKGYQAPSTANLTQGSNVNLNNVPKSVQNGADCLVKGIVPNQPPVSPK